MYYDSQNSNETVYVDGTSNNTTSTNPIETSETPDTPEIQETLFDLMKKTQYYNFTSNTIEKDWEKENKITSVKHQGSCGACWSFAAIGAIEAMYKIYND